MTRVLRSRLLAIFCAVLGAGILVAPAGAQGPSPNDLLAPVPDPAIAAAPQSVRALAATFAPDEFSALFLGLLHFVEDSGNPQKAQVAVKPVADMPLDEPYYHYAGQTNDGRMLIWESTNVQTMDADGDASGLTPHSDDVILAATGPATADSGEAGTYWKQRYAAIADKGGLGRAMALLFRIVVETEHEKANSDTAWLRRALVTGMSRQETYALLRHRGLVAYNADYNPGFARPAPSPVAGEGLEIGGSCSYIATESRSYWPYFREPLPKRSGVCANADERVRFVPNPLAFVDIAVGMSFACGVSRQIRLEYNMRDMLNAVHVSNDSVGCL